MSDSSPNSDKPGSSWVTFDEDKLSEITSNRDAAVLDTETIEVTAHSSETSTIPKKSKPDHSEGEKPKQQQTPENNGHTKTPIHSLNAGALQNIPLNDTGAQSTDSYASPVIRQGFANGDVIVTILPQNRTFPWITPAQFRPELVPEELMAQGLTLTVEDYVHIMSQLVNDHRFTVYNMCYKRILMLWISVAFLILLAILFAGFHHLAMFGAGIAWLLFNALAIFFCMWIKIGLNKNLERCLAKINIQLMKHNIILGVDDRGKLSCHKVHLCFIYFDAKECVAKLQQLIDDKQLGVSETSGTPRTNDDFMQNLDVEDPEIIITGSTNTRVNKQQTKAQLLLARYSQRWAKLIIRGGLTLGIDAAERHIRNRVITPVPPRHISTRQCLCHFIEEHVKYKPTGFFSLCGFWQNRSSTPTSPSGIGFS